MPDLWSRIQNLWRDELEQSHEAVESRRILETRIEEWLTSGPLRPGETNADREFEVKNDKDAEYTAWVYQRENPGVNGQELLDKWEREHPSRDLRREAQGQGPGGNSPNLLDRIEQWLSSVPPRDPNGADALLQNRVAQEAQRVERYFQQNNPELDSGALLAKWEREHPPQARFSGLGQAILDTGSLATAAMASTNRPSYYGNLSEREAGRNEFAAELTARLGTQAEAIRNDWTAAKSQDYAPPDLSEAYFAGQITAYNDVAIAIHKQHNQGAITIEKLPEILHPEGVWRGVQQAATYIESQHSMSQEQAARHAAEVENAVVSALGSMASEPEMKHEEGLILSV
jgi:hypothetical protein